MSGAARWAILGCVLATVANADDWPQWRGSVRDGVWRETGIVAKLPEKLDVKWRTPIGAGYAGPAVANGKVYVSDRQLSKGEANPDNPFSKDPVGGTERLVCLDEKTGEIVWKHEYPCRYTISYPAGPRATPTVHEGKVYHLGAMGDFAVLDAETGKVLWTKNYPKDFGTVINDWGMSAAPLIDGPNVILLVGGTNHGCVVALDRATGAEVWRALEAPDPGYCPPTFIEAGGVRQLIIWNPVGLYSLNPETGKTYWEQAFPLKANLSISTPIYDPESRILFVTSFYNGSMAMKLDADAPTATLLWKGKGKSEMERETADIHAIMCTPVFLKDHIFGVCSYGQLRCIDAATGDRVWETFEATGHGRWWNAFIIPHEDHYFLANEQGDLIIAKLSPKGYEEISRSFLIAPTNRAVRRKIVWSHPAFANRCVFARNDEEIVCVDLSAK